MKYYCIIKSHRPTIRGIPPLYDTPKSGIGGQAWPDTPEGRGALKVWSVDFTDLYEMIKIGKASLYTFTGPPPVELPFEVGLQRIDPENARSLNDVEYNEAIKLLKQYDFDLINHPDSYDDIKRTPEIKHSLGELISALSNVCKTIAPIVISKPYDYEMSQQVVVSEPVIMKRIDKDILGSIDAEWSLQPGDITPQGQKLVGPMEEPEERESWEQDPDAWKESFDDKLNNALFE